MKWLTHIMAICLLILLLNLNPFALAATTATARWQCGWMGKIVNCEFQDGRIVPTTVEYLLRQYFGDVEEEARKIVQCESGFDNSAIGKAGEIGIFQIHPVHFKEVEGLKLYLHTLRGNFAYSRILYGRSGWKDWSCAH